ncbi:MAG TPA: Ig-like domain-containing protein, partial [Deinococcales bacterium]|nr:Ig-like domain-containing protein [Deinococcales bacterium]
MLRTRYLLPLLVTLISCGAQNVTPPLPQAPAVASLDVSPASALLVRAGETRQLQARALDANGKEVTASVTWHSAGPGVTVDATGRVTAATAVGSSLVTARVGEVTSAPVAVIVAAPAEGALIVSDQQVLAVGNPQEGEAPLGSGSRYNVTLTGVPTPAPGTIVIASGTAPVSGRVISSQVAGNQVNTVLEVVRPDELFQQHSINLDFDLRDLSLSPDYTTAQPQRQPNGTWSLARPASTGVRPMAEQKLGEKKFERGPLACEASASAKITTTAFDISLGGNPSFSYQDANTGAGRHVKAAISGDIVLSVAGGVKVDAGFEGKAECRLVHRIPIPIGGPLSPFLMAGVPIGLGLAAEGKLTAATLEYRTEGKIGAAVELGIECKPNTGCKSLDKITPINEVKPKPTILPGPNNMRLEAGLSLFLVSGIDLIALGYKPYGLIEVTAGIRQDINLALTEAQALDKSYASSYELKLQAKAGLGSNAQEAIKKLVGPNVAVNLGVGIDYPLAKSPAGNLTPDKTRTAVGEAVEMVVELDPATVNYGPLGYN